MITDLDIEIFIELLQAGNAVAIFQAKILALTLLFCILAAINAYVQRNNINEYYNG